MFRTSFSPHKGSVEEDNQSVGSENKSDPPYPFVAGKHFNIIISLNEQEYHIHINHQLYARYRHRLPYSMVTELRVRGDVAITSLCKQDAVITPCEGQTRINLKPCE